jgi:hypothetical protein
VNSSITGNFKNICVIFSVVGLPEKQDWPDGVSIPWASFSSMPRQIWENVIPNMESDAIDLLEVSSL